jgi:uncharacterized damage-inducible protein DinB
VISLQLLLDLYRHMEWADASVWNSVLASSAGPTDTRLRDLLYHLHMVQRAFLRMWHGEPRENPYPTFEQAKGLMAWGRSYYDEAYAYLGRLDEAGVAAELAVPWAAMVEQRLGRTPSGTTVGETGLQVALHSTYHRGQVTARLREVGGEPPLVDYIAWVWLGRPAAEWPAVASGDAPN